MEYVAQAISRRELRILAANMRNLFNMEDVTYIPIVKILEILPYVIPGSNYEIVYPEDLEENEHAVTDIISKTIKIRDDVYDGACAGNGRDRMTVAHEIAHLFLICVCGLKLARSFNENEPIPAFRNPEWQAKCLAGEFLIDYKKIKDMNALQVATACGVSIDAAKVQLAHL